MSLFGNVLIPNDFIVVHTFFDMGFVHRSQFIQERDILAMRGRGEHDTGTAFVDGMWTVLPSSIRLRQLEANMIRLLPVQPQEVRLAREALLERRTYQVHPLADLAAFFRQEDTIAIHYQRVWRG